MSKQNLNLNELHDHFLNIGFSDLTDQELKNINGGSFYVQGVDYGTYANFYAKYGSLWNCLTGN